MIRDYLYFIRTTELQQLHNVRQIITILSITLISSLGEDIINLLGRVDAKIENFNSTMPMGFREFNFQGVRCDN